jgi:hypothetical protein
MTEKTWWRKTPDEWLPVEWRGWVYRVLTALVPLLAAVGFVTGEVGFHVVAFVGAVIGPGMAAAHTPVKVNDS